MINSEFLFTAYWWKQIHWHGDTVRCYRGGQHHLKCCNSRLGATTKKVLSSVGSGKNRTAPSVHQPYVNVSTATCREHFLLELELVVIVSIPWACIHSVRRIGNGNRRSRWPIALSKVQTQLVHSYRDSMPSHI